MEPPTFVSFEGILEGIAGELTKKSLISSLPKLNFEIFIRQVNATYGRCTLDNLL